MIYDILISLIKNIIHKIIFFKNEIYDMYNVRMYTTKKYFIRMTSVSVKKDTHTHCKHVHMEHNKK